MGSEMPTVVVSVDMTIIPASNDAVLITKGVNVSAVLINYIMNFTMASMYIIDDMAIYLISQLNV